MRQIFRLTLTIILAMTSLFILGCSSTSEEPKKEVSSIPWNRPQKWEGGGTLGGMMGGGSR